MTRPAALRFGVVGVALLAGCWRNDRVESATAPAVAGLAPRPSDLIGKYWCKVDPEGEDDPRYLCVIKKVGEGLVFAKLDGEERIRGRIALDDRDGFTFVGERYCPWGEDCKETLHGRFRPVGKGGFKGTFREGELVVHLTPAPADAIGGDGFDDELGDRFGVDGAGYGGDGYGGPWRFDSRGRRKR